MGLIVEEVTQRIIGAAIEVHRELGPGLLESSYEACLEYELRSRGMWVERQKELPVHYRGLKVDCAYRIDLLVQESVIVEVKSVDELHPLHQAQLMTYLRLTGIRVGLLMNFNVRQLTHGLKRLVL